MKEFIKRHILKGRHDYLAILISLDLLNDPKAIANNFIFSLEESQGMI